MRQRLSETLQAAATDALDQRVKPVEALADDAAQVAAACHAMAVRFHRGGKLVCFGSGGPSTDAQHIAVEFVHPVIVGKRALPAISLTGDVATLTSIAGREGYAEVYAHQLRHLAAPEDIALGVSVDGNDPAVQRGLEAAAELGISPSTVRAPASALSSAMKRQGWRLLALPAIRPASRMRRTTSSGISRSAYSR
jgi:D-sedoheptulose 7-phosphate isomerase